MHRINTKDVQIKEAKPTEVYFPNLNGIRAIAAFMVIVFHIELIKSEFAIGNVMDRFTLGGDLGVVLFFVLSGFLITYLLLTEQKLTGTISLKNFYARRILRIWPLYFIIVLSCLFILPNISFLYEPPYSTTYIQNRFVIIFLYLLFLSNFLTGADSHVNFARPTWSVSVEEQFYLLWPVLMKFSKNKYKIILVVIVFYWIIRIILLFLTSWHLKPYNHSFYEYAKVMSLVWYYTPFDSLSVGALAAMAFFNKSPVLNIIYKKGSQICIFIVIPVFIYILKVKANISFFFNDMEVTNEFYSAIFALAILNLAGNENVVFSLENKVLSYLGKISYGLYLYHWVVIVAVINFLHEWIPDLVPNGFVFNSLLYASCIALTIIIASISYYLIEIKFLKLKHRFSRIISGDLVKKQ